MICPYCRAWNKKDAVACDSCGDTLDAPRGGVISQYGGEESPGSSRPTLLKRVVTRIGYVPIAFFILMIAIPIGTYFVSWQPFSRLSDINHKALRLMEEGRYEEAIIHYDQVIAAYPDSERAGIRECRGMAYFYRGVCRDRLGQRTAAQGEETTSEKIFNLVESDYSEAIRLSRDGNRLHLATALNNRGELRLRRADPRQSDLQAAASDFNDSLTAYDLPAAWHNLGRVQLKQKNPDRAIESFSAALSCDPEYGPAYCMRGIAYEQKGQIKKALVDYRRFVKLNPPQMAEDVRLIRARIRDFEGRQ